MATWWHLQHPEGDQQTHKGKLEHLRENFIPLGSPLGWYWKRIDRLPFQTHLEWGVNLEGEWEEVGAEKAWQGGQKQGKERLGAANPC